MIQAMSYLQIFPQVYGEHLAQQDLTGLEEIRMRIGQPVLLRFNGREEELWPKTAAEHLEEIVQRACHHSVYSHMSSLRDGYLTIEGGHRLGICGKGVMEGDTLHVIQMPSSICLRIAKQVQGCGEILLPFLTKSVLILGPPGRGKTTLLRDVVRLLSDQMRQSVGLVDERGEIAACVMGRPQLYVGKRTDILVNIRKSTAIMMLLRTMTPQWIAVDEITDPRDIDAMEQASYCGISLLATAHAADINDLGRRPLYRQLLRCGIFPMVFIIGEDRSVRVEEVSV